MPLVVRVWERVLSLDVVDRCLIATDSEEVADVADEYGAEVVMTRALHPSGTHRAAEVALMPAYSDYSTIVNVQGDEPFVPRSAIVGATRLVNEARFPLGTAAVVAPGAVLSDPNVVKVVAAQDGRAMYFSRAPIPYLRDAADAPLQRPLVWQHIGVYAYDWSALQQWIALPETPLEQIERLEQLRPLAAGIAMGVSVIDEPVHPGIDTEEDLERANREWSAFTTG